MKGRRTEIVAAAAWFAMWAVLLALDSRDRGPVEALPAPIGIAVFGVLAQVALGYVVGRGWALLCPCVATGVVLGIGLLEPHDEYASGAAILIFVFLPVGALGVAIGYGLRQWVDPGRRPT